MLTYRIAWRQLRQRPARALLTWLSVVIGVAAVLAVRLSTDSARRAYQEMYEAITGGAALEVTGIGGTTMDAALLEVVRQTPGVSTAVPLIQRNAIMYYGRGRMKLIALGIDVTQDNAIRDYQLVAGSKLSPRGGVLLNASLAENLGVKVGDEIKLLVRRGLVRTRVVGLVEPRSGAGVASGGVLFMPLPIAQRRFAAPGKIDRVQVVLADEAKSVEVQAQLQSRLPADVQVQPPPMRSALAEETIRALENGLRLATAFTLLAAVFIMMNTFSMNVGQRRRQLAVMRAIGATRQQIGRLVFGEALLLGLLGTLGGFVVGLIGARGLNQAMGGLFQSSLPPTEPKMGPMLVAAAFGLGVSSLGAWLPSRRAGRVTPLEGMSGIAPEDTDGHFWQQVAIGTGMSLVSIASLTACLVGWLPLEHSVIATVALLVSLVLLLPLVLRPLTWLTQSLMQPLAGVEAQLARRQLLRHSGRTTLTVGVLFVAVATGLGLANSVVDNVADVRNWYRTTIVGDFFVHAQMPDMETGLSAVVPEVVGEQIQQIEGITGITSLRMIAATANDQHVIVMARRREFPAGEAAAVSDADSLIPASGSVTIGSVLAQRTGLKVGDCLTLESRQGPQCLPITEIKNEYLAGGLMVRMDRETADRLLGAEGIDAYIVKADHARLAAVESALQELCNREGILLQSYADLTRAIEGMMSGVIGSLWGLLVLGLIVAAFGVANTLGMNVLEQTRELGLLRVVAMTRWQVRKTIVSQAAMLGLLGVVPGLLAGVSLAYFLNLATMPTIGHPVAFMLHPRLLGGCFAAALAMVLLAAWVPAERAARLEPTAALRYE